MYFLVANNYRLNTRVREINKVKYLDGCPFVPTYSNFWLSTKDKHVHNENCDFVTKKRCKTRLEVVLSANVNGPEK